MANNTKEKALIILKENGILFKIKNFFNNFLKKDNYVEDNIKNLDTYDAENVEMVKQLDNKMDVLELQKEYRAGKINAEDLTLEQVELLNDLYDKQIQELKRSNEFRKKKILTYKTKLGLD